MWLALIANLAVVSLFISAWAMAQDWLQARPRRTRALLFSALMGLATIASMLLSVEVQSGIIIDFRTTIIALSGFLAGPLAGLLTGAIAALCRVAIGGAGLWAGLAAILIALLVGAAGHLALRGRQPRTGEVLLFAAATAVLPRLGLLALPPEAWGMALQAIAPLAVLTFVSTTLAAIVLLHSQHRAEERNILLTALAQAPDYLYVKNRQGHFVTANRAVAKVSGFAEPAEMRGKSDFDIRPNEHAAALFEAEQRMLSSGQALLEYEEQIADKPGDERWFATSKALLRNAAGETIGLIGVTRDITEQKTIERDMLNSRNQLSYVLTEMSDGLALFDNSGHIAFCNEQYRAMFPRTGPFRVNGAYLPDILRKAIESGEQIDIPADKVNRWVAGIMQALKTGADEEAHMFDGRWLHIRTKPLANGGATVVVSDISTIKRAEARLMVLTEQLKLLATTDGLTALLNRRAFDDSLEKELARGRRSHQSISLIMIDIDRFKAFNDLYGHPAGDECIRRVAGVVRSKMRRPADLVARYGGEELCVILPDTAEDGAYFLAEEIRQAVRAMNLEHHGSDKGVVTISLGVATYRPEDLQRTALDLVSRADEALYVAKGAGRDRVAGWTEHSVAELPAAG